MTTKRKNVAILGSTGSIGRTTLRVLSALSDRFSVLALTANRQGEELFAQAQEYQPALCVICDETTAITWAECFSLLGIELLTGEEALLTVAQHPAVDVVVCALNGIAGFRSLYAAVEAGKEVLFANKEALVAGGRIITELVAQKQVRFLPIDSEHSALFQCLLAGRRQEVQSITLTASGGPCWQLAPELLRTVSKEQVLAHPLWHMGAFVTVNSATFINKGYEVIEASYLFDLPREQIKVLIHPEGIVHGLVEFCDGSVLAQLSRPDMALPIQYALTAPERLPSLIAPLNLAQQQKLSFYPPNGEKFPALALAYEALGGEWWEPTALNAINEVLVQAFLADEISFWQLLRFLPVLFSRRQQVWKQVSSSQAISHNLDGVLLVDSTFRQFAQEELPQLQSEMRGES